MINRSYFVCGTIKTDRGAAKFDGVFMAKSMFSNPRAMWENIRKFAADKYGVAANEIDITKMERIR
ncbi:MAG: hypothetical protein KAV87_00090 [Desulfobacteraceae bacterium]|nr:hypothetical protein [Desulfobacteraceae bacterium]